MNALPRYLLKAREALASVPPGGATTAVSREPTCEKSEESEKRQFIAGGRYRASRRLVGVVHRTTEEVREWREAAGLPRAGLMTIDGELVLVADVRATVQTGWFDVVAVPPARTQP